MTGIRNFNLCRLGAIALVATSASVYADELLLDQEAKLTGTVTAIQDNGSVQVKSPLSPDPLVLKPRVMKKVIFSNAPDAPATGSTRVKLLSGDVLPCELKTLDGSTLKVGTSFAGDLAIPRDAVTSLELGILAEKPIYVHQEGAEGWATSSWRFKEGAFASMANGPLSRSFNLPDQYILRFKLGWKNSPNIRISFADPLDPQARTIDRYLIQFNTAGFSLQRQNSVGRTYVPFITLARRPDSFRNSEMEIEVRVDRTQSMVWLYLDGNLEGRFNDPGTPPKAGGLSFESNTGNEAEHRISDLKILSWDATGDRHRTEDRGDRTQDALIDAEGDRYSGRLESVKPSNEGAETTLMFRSKLLEKPIVIPAKKVSTVFFADPAPPKEKQENAPMVLKLRDGGRLQIQHCNFAGDELMVTHPLLGQMTLKRSSVLSIEQSADEKKPEPKDE